MYLFFLIMYFKTACVSTYIGSVEGLCKLIDLSLGIELEARTLKITMDCCNLRKYGFLYKSKNDNMIIISYE